MSAITQTSTTPGVQPVRQSANSSAAEIAVFFSTFNTFGEPSLVEALHEAKRFCAAMASANVPAYWLSLLGKSGTGKTMLARAVNRFFSRRLDGYEDEAQSIPGKARFYRKGGFKPWASVIGEMIAGDFTGIRNLSEDWFVALDDIGAEYGGNRELSVSKLYEVLNRREGRFTIITANLDLQAVAQKLDARIASRLLRDGNTVVDVVAPDFNLR